jgi:CheY-like chemotaxis protein
MPVRSNSDSNPPFRILRGSDREQLLRQLNAAHSQGWSLIGEITRLQLEDGDRWYCQVVPSDEPTTGIETGDHSTLAGTKPVRILLVEDHANTGEVLARMIRNHGMAVDHVLKGSDARTKVAEQKYDVLISDIGLPDTDGWTLLRELRSLQPDLKAIAMTGFGQPDDFAKSKEAGFQEHLIKPPTSEAVFAAIRAVHPDL